MAQLPKQARPPDKQTPALPPPFEEILPSGLVVKWRMPDPFAVIAFDGVLPDPITAAVIRLLSEEKASTPDINPHKFRNDAQSIKGMYGIVAAMLEEPRLDLSVEYGSNGTLGRREIGALDVNALYWRFRVATRLPAPEDAARADDADTPTDAAPAGGDLRDDAGGAGGDS